MGCQNFSGLDAPRVFCRRNFNRDVVTTVSTRNFQDSQIRLVILFLLSRGRGQIFCITETRHSEMAAHHFQQERLIVL